MDPTQLAQKDERRDSTIDRKAEMGEPSPKTSSTKPQGGNKQADPPAAAKEETIVDCESDELGGSGRLYPSIPRDKPFLIWRDGECEVYNTDTNPPQLYRAKPELVNEYYFDAPARPLTPQRVWFYNLPSDEFWREVEETYMQNTAAQQICDEQIQKTRIAKYGEEIALRYEVGDTPAETRKAWEERVEEMRRNALMPTPPTPE